MPILDQPLSTKVKIKFNIQSVSVSSWLKVTQREIMRDRRGIVRKPNMNSLFTNQFKARKQNY